MYDVVQYEEKMKMYKKLAIMLSMLLIMLLSGCISISVEQKTTELEVRQTYFLNALFESEDEEVKITSDSNSYTFDETGEQTIKITAQKGKKSEEFEFKFNVVDTKGPIFSSQKDTLEYGEKYDPLDLITVSDNYSDKENIQVEVISDEINTKKPGEYSVEYKAVDEAGNETSKTYTITVLPKPLKIGDKIKTRDFEFTLRDVRFTYDLIPNTSAIIYHHYPADVGQVYLYIKADIKNTSEYTLECQELYDVEVIYDETYKYDGVNILRGSDGDFDNAYMWDSIAPLKTQGIDALVDCPKEAKTKTKKSIGFWLKFSDGSKRYYKIR